MRLAAHEIDADAGDGFVVRDAERPAEGARRPAPYPPRDLPRLAIVRAHQIGHPLRERERAAGAQLLLDARQRLVEQVVSVVMRPHAVAEEHDQRGLGARRLAQLREREIEAAVDLEQGIADLAGHRRIVSRVRSVVQVPALVRDTVRVAEAQREQVPAPASHQVARQFALQRDPAGEPREKLAVVAGLAARRVVAHAHRIGAVALEDLGGQIRR